jgi:hypothetical protein
MTPPAFKAGAIGRSAIPPFGFNLPLLRHAISGLLHPKPMKRRNSTTPRLNRAGTTEIALREVYLDD